MKVPFEYEPYSYQWDRAIPRAKCRDCGSKDIYTKNWYTPDFHLANDIIIEAKGKFGVPDRKKMIQMKKDHPELDIRLVFMRDNKIHRTSKTRYSTWAEANGIQYAVGEVPEDWTKEIKGNV